jgi:hypothetical protein
LISLGTDGCSQGESWHQPSSFTFLEEELCQRRLPISHAAAIAFTESCWESIDAQPARWYAVERFVEANGAIAAALVEVG